MVLRAFTAKDVEKYAGISREVQRDRRRRGFFHYFGEADERGRWKYTAGDLLGLAIADIGMSQLNEAFEAERLGNWAKGEVAKHIGLTVPDISEFFELLPKDAIGSGETQSMSRGLNYCIFAKGRNPIFTDFPEKIHDMDVSSALVLDLRNIAKSLDSELVRFLKASANL